MTKHHSHSFSSSELSGTDYQDSTFISCRFAHPLHFLNFVRCTFQDCDFSGSSFETVSFEDCSFMGSKLSHLDFQQARFKSCNLDHAVINNAIFQDFKPGSTNERIRYDLSTCSFAHTELENTIFVKCNLTGVSLEGANLKGAVFERCDLTDTNLTDAKIEQINLQGSKIHNTALSLAGFLTLGAAQGFVIDDPGS
jgi:fluoroquinolone resistance protein